ncbi:MAG: VOC family protein [Chitinophagaceae bacterium]|nr:MAG: VOC family protein [Chitinophagaceae bacterium]
MQKITPFLWFDGNAEEAARFYTSVFPDAKITGGMPGPNGKPVVVAFELAGQTFTALNGGPQFKFNESISFVVHCADQAEIDFYWNALTADGGAPSRCGWLKDQFGLSWQIIPRNLSTLLSRPGAMDALMTMDKIEIAQLESAAPPTQA